MNEQIKKIAKECGLYIAYDNKAVTDKEIEFFAEQIVRECTAICDSAQLQYGQYTFTATTVKNRIREHFGVE